jgi:hypothetical protein
VASEVDRDWLEEKLEYSHEPNLAKRLREVMARCAQVSRRIVGNSKARGSFAWKVVETRNFETHLDRSKERLPPASR